ncbi:MAG: hypothetical protein WCR02_12615 [Sphaerochaetaceae bacterium]|jgi:hypothetical protein
MDKERQKQDDPFKYVDKSTKVAPLKVRILQIAFAVIICTILIVGIVQNA